MHDWPFSLDFWAWLNFCLLAVLLDDEPTPVMSKRIKRFYMKLVWAAGWNGTLRIAKLVKDIGKILGASVLFIKPTMLQVVLRFL